MDKERTGGVAQSFRISTRFKPGRSRSERSVGMGCHRINDPRTIHSNPWNLECNRNPPRCDHALWRARPTSLRRFAQGLAMAVPARNKRMENSELTKRSWICGELCWRLRATNPCNCRLTATKGTEIGPMQPPSCRETPTPWSRFRQAADRRTDPMSRNCDMYRRKIRRCRLQDQALKSPASSRCLARRR